MAEQRMAEQHTFQAEIKQLLHILVHSLYTDREIFLRELISNASDALSKVQIEKLSRPADDLRDPDAELAVQVYVNPAERQIRLVDTGLGMTHDELIENLGTIAQSGARSFMERMQAAQSNSNSTDLIGQFGVGFYSVFMVADRVEVTSRSIQPDAEAYTWVSAGEDSYEIYPADKAERGTEIVIYLREEDADFANAWKIREIIKRHSDYVSFPIYLIDETPAEPSETEADTETDDAAPQIVEPAPAPEVINQQTAIWRRQPDEISDEDYDNYYRQLTLDFEPPAMRIHGRGDAPIQYYALLFIPKQAERNMFSLRKEPGLKLYARKILIEEYTTALLPEYLQFVQGVVDSEDISLNVSRESAQTTPQMTKLRQTLTRKVLTELKRLAESDAERYLEIWAEYGPFLKHGVVAEYSDRDRLLPLLRFHTSHTPEADATSEADKMVTLDAYVERMAEGQEAIYYLSSDNLSAARHSAHLAPFNERGIEVLFLVDSVDGFLVDALREHQGHTLVSIDSADLELEGVGQQPETPADDDDAPQVDQDQIDGLIVEIRNQLGEAVESVRISKVMTSANAVRLVNPEGAMNRHTQRVYQMLERDFEVPARILEINPRHPIVRNLAAQLQRNGADEPRLTSTIRLLYENALLADGIHPNPAELATQIQGMMQLATSLDTDN